MHANPLNQMMTASAETQRAQAKGWRDAAQQDRRSADACLQFGDREGHARWLRRAEQCDRWAADCDSAAADFARLAQSAVAA